MPDEARPIFRHEALNHFVRGQQMSVLPRFIRPRTFLCLWLLLGLLVSAGILACIAQVPVYVSGIAVVTDSSDGVALAVILPADASDRLNVGQTVWMQAPGVQELVATRITHLDRKIKSPAAVRKQFGLCSDTFNQAAIVATADAKGIVAGEDLPLRAHVGSTMPVNVEIGSRRALSLLIGR
jgi:hypothetical protein